MKIRSHKDLVVYQIAFDAAAVDIYNISKLFPAEEKYSLTDKVLFSFCLC